MDDKSNIDLIFFYMQRNMLEKLTTHLCRLAKDEFKAACRQIPDSVRETDRFDKLFTMIDEIDNNEIEWAKQYLGCAYNEYMVLLGYLPPELGNTKQEQPTNSSTLDGHRETPWKPELSLNPQAASTPVINDVQQTDTRAEHNADVTRDTTSDTDNETIDGLGDTGVWNYANTVTGTTSNVSMEQSGNKTTNDVRRRFTQTETPTAQEVITDAVINATDGRHACLVERFHDLYEKEWSSAFQELSTVLGEKQAARHLLWVIAKASIGCATHASQQLLDLENSVIGIMVANDPLHKAITVEKPLSGKSGIAVTNARRMLLDYREAIARLSVPLLQKEMRQSIVTELNTTLPRRFTGIGHSFVEYAEVCTEVIWLMHVHDTPLCLEWLTKEQEGAHFETDLYRAYTRPGTIYDYCVWPVIRLHESGPVLVKGLAEGK